MMTPETLAAIRERAEKAIEGPWVAEFSGEQGNCVLPHDAQSTREAVAITRLYYQVFDAEFIAHAREDVPALLAEVERLNRKFDAVSRLWAEAVSSRKEIDLRTLARILDGGDQ